ncbi:7alpha-cephem-methoxylase-like protein [Grosmannia clavigera kw1407]|uniref:7alpha-cephem-methoxylase-like protein n=1 Tax=Grosmannia clavigera (strain kw1407 / UAMH 11150) TaxID=655863 RepID=F0XTZ3_GROCL|nr:7alpha-cephem-methoxylase-like protein [Grosmannia clavigera kw1407]EFW98533.1 7alpha-cephem-methoxylase-like protein [Grosmannia clavigera kw1407]
MAISSTPSDRVPRGDVRAELNFFNPPADGAKPFNYVDNPPEGEPERNFTYATHEVLIQDARGRNEFTKTPASLDHNAFLIVEDLPPSAEADFVDDESIRAKYYPEVEELLLRHVPGANRVVFFDHTVRRAGSDGPRGPVTRAHIDQTADAAAQRVRRHLPADDAEKLLQGRYRIINVWRPLNKGPVESFPLAFASSASVADKDVVPIEHRYPKESGGYVGHTAGIRYSPEQKWYYLSGMTGSERILIECFDSEALKDGTAVAGGRLAHSAFEHPGSLSDAEGRESIEVRTLVFGP